MPQVRHRTQPLLRHKRYKANEFGMSDREFRLASAYLMEPLLSKAAYAAGYRGLHLADRARIVLTRPQVAKYVADQRAKLSKQYEVTTERIIRELALMAFSNMSDYTRLVGTERVIDLSETSRDQMAAVAELTSETYVEEKGEEASDDVVVKKTKLKLYPKRDPLIDLGKTLGLFKDDKMPAGTSFEFTLNLGSIGGDGDTQVRVQATVKEKDEPRIIEGEVTNSFTAPANDDEND